MQALCHPISLASIQHYSQKPVCKAAFVSLLVVSLLTVITGALLLSHHYHLFSFSLFQPVNALTAGSILGLGTFTVFSLIGILIFSRKNPSQRSSSFEVKRLTDDAQKPPSRQNSFLKLKQTQATVISQKEIDIDKQIKSALSPSLYSVYEALKTFASSDPKKNPTAIWAKDKINQLRRQITQGQPFPSSLEKLTLKIPLQYHFTHFNCIACEVLFLSDEVFLSMPVTDFNNWESHLKDPEAAGLLEMIHQRGMILSKKVSNKPFGRGTLGNLLQRKMDETSPFIHSLPPFCWVWIRIESVTENFFQGKDPSAFVQFGFYPGSQHSHLLYTQWNAQRLEVFPTSLINDCLPYLNEKQFRHIPSIILFNTQVDSEKDFRFDTLFAWDKIPQSVFNKLFIYSSEKEIDTNLLKSAYEQFQKIPTSFLPSLFPILAPNQLPLCSSEQLKAIPNELLTNYSPLVTLLFTKAAELEKILKKNLCQSILSGIGLEKTNTILPYLPDLHYLPTLFLKNKQLKISSLSDDQLNNQFLAIDSSQGEEKEEQDRLKVQKLLRTLNHEIIAEIQSRLGEKQREVLKTLTNP